MVKRDLLSIADLSSEEVMKVLNSGKELKSGARSDCLAGRSVALLFEKPSLRTRVSFDLAVHQLGGHPIYFGAEEVGLGKREPVADVARVLERYVDAIVARTFAHFTLVELAGLESPASFEGSSLVNLLRGSPGSAPGHVFMESGLREDQPQLTVRRGRWKHIEVMLESDRVGMTGERFELYDLEADPHELDTTEEEDGCGDRCPPRRDVTVISGQHRVQSTGNNENHIQEGGK